MDTLNHMAATTVPCFNRSAFQIIETAAKIIDFPGSLLRLDDRKHFENFLAQLQSTENEYPPSKLDIIDKATTELREKLAATATPPSAAIDESSTFVNTGGQVGNVYDNVAAPLGPTSQSLFTHNLSFANGFTLPDLGNIRPAVGTSASGVQLPSQEAINHTIQSNLSTSTASQTPVYFSQNSTHTSQTPTYTSQTPAYTPQVPTYTSETSAYAPQTTSYIPLPSPPTNFIDNNPTVPYTNHANTFPGDAESPYREISAESRAKTLDPRYTGHMSDSIWPSYQKDSSTFDTRNEKSLVVAQPNTTRDVTNRNLGLAKPNAPKRKAESTTMYPGVSKPKSKAQTSGSKQSRGGKTACKKCQKWKKPCVPIDPDDPEGPCEACVKNPNSIYSGLDCSKRNLGDLVMYRGGNKKQSTSEPLRLAVARLNLKAREFNLNSPIWSIEFHFGRGLVWKSLGAQVREYIVTNQEANAEPGSAQAFYKDHPYRLCDPARFFQDFQAFSGAIATQQAFRLRKENDWTRLEHQMFHKAYEVANRHPNPDVKKLIVDILNFWTMARMYEGGWTLSPSSEEPISNILANTDVTEMHYIDHQLALTIKSALENICKVITGERLKKLFESIDADNWMPKFLASYVLLQNWEMLMKQQNEVARSRKVLQRFSNAALLDYISLSANNVLHHYHYSSSNQERFKIDWENRGKHEINGFNETDQKWLFSIASEVASAREHLRSVCERQHWDEALSFTGMLFDRTMVNKLKAQA